MSNKTSSKKHQTVLITGASAGIGKSFAKVFARQGYDLVLVARRLDKLEQLASTLESQYGVQTHYISADLAKVSTPKKLYEELQQKGLAIDVLVNNAGYALNKPFTSASWKEHTDFINVMMTSVTHLCYLFSKDMVSRGYGRILNVSSVAAFAPQWGGSLYGAAKSYVKDFSEALDLELRDQGVNCMALCPGFTYSEFHSVMGISSSLKKLPKWLWMDADTVAEQGFQALMKGKIRHVSGLVNQSMVTAFDLLPGKVKYLISQKQNVL